MVHNGLLKRERVVTVSIILIMLLFSILFIVPVIAMAADGQDYFTQLVQFYSAQGARDALGLDMYDTIASISDVILDVFTGISIIWITAILIYSVIKEFSMGDATMSMWLKVLIKIAIGIFLIVSVKEILNGIDTIGQWIIDSIAQAPFASGPGEVNIGSLGGSMLIAVFSLFLIAYIKICSYALMIEIGIRRIFAPLAVGSIITNGIRSAGMRYLRKYLAVYLKMGIMVVTLLIGGVLTKAIIGGQTVGEYMLDGMTPGILGNFSGNIITVLAILCSCTTFIGKGAKLADEIANATGP